MNALRATIVSCAHVDRHYGSTLALTDASCEVAEGELIAIMGPSGSGKSTLLHLLAGLDNPTRGELSWPALGGNPSAQAGSLGIILQGPSLLPSLNAAENVMLPLIFAGSSIADALPAAGAALAQVGLKGYESRLPEELSGGQAQRVALARVLAGSPRLIIADEPTGQLDSANAANVMELLVACARSIAATLLVCTHDPVVAAYLDVQWQVIDARLHTPKVRR